MRRKLEEIESYICRFKGIEVLLTVAYTATYPIRCTRKTRELPIYGGRNIKEA